MKQLTDNELVTAIGTKRYFIRAEPNTGGIIIESAHDGATYTTVKTFTSFEETWYEVKDVRLRFLLTGDAEIFIA